MDDEGNFALDAEAPRAEVTLPDGQHLQAVVLRRRLDRSGTWWYDLAVELPDRVDDRRRGPSLGSRTVTFCAPFPLVQPIPGVSYASLDLPPPEERKRWRLSPPTRAGWADACLHRPDCAQAGSTGGLVTDEEALAALAGHDMVTLPCPVCRPDTVLQHRR
ncbi:DUF6233 domain-containing protein [Streptomyces sp. NPDC021749]|uniref:DUF6233 domain-containing protein n=1 Tax=Streptomyces sp. NPDC021749 TaxID=3154905 RepID=UPI0033DC8A9C